MLTELADESVDCCVTSPPYWALRDYGTAEWEGGDPGCDHRGVHGKGGGSSAQDGLPYGGGQAHVAGSPARGGDPYRCRCGATRVDQQLGLEPTPMQYVERLVDVFAEVHRVLRKDGTLWLNLGDTYAGNRSYQVPDSKHRDVGNSRGMTVSRRRDDYTIPRSDLRVPGAKPKDLIGVPWRVAFALQDDGWWLRSEIIWHKVNAMPESVTDRPTKAHEQVFLFAKSERYYFDQDAVREPAKWERWGTQTVPKYEGTSTATGWMKERSKDDLSRYRSGNKKKKHGADVGVPGAHPGDLGRSIPWEYDGRGRNTRSVWPIPTEPYPDAHFAVFPTELARRCILAGCPQGGVVLDPFAGSGTTLDVARKHSRRAIGIELNLDYCGLIATRLQQLSLLSAVE